jgi:DNA-binding NarL/FixJ family response regulator
VTRIVIADDQSLVRSGIRIILEQQDDLEVVGEASDGVEAVELVQQHDPDIALLDIRMPELSGLDAARLILARSTNTRVLLLTTYDVDDYVARALRDGASGYLLKDAPPAELVRGVRAAARGDTVLAPAVLARIVDDFTRREFDQDAGDAAGFDRLSEREKEVLRALARGFTNAEIASDLFLSPATVKTHIASILGKLGLRDRLQAVIAAYESGFITPAGGPGGTRRGPDAPGTA